MSGKSQETAKNYIALAKEYDKTTSAAFPSFERRCFGFFSVDENL
jgi:hypothetical protein